MTEFELLDDERVPSVIRPMVKLHDKLVEGYREERNIRTDKLILKLEQSIGTQVEELVKLEDKQQISAIMLINAMNCIKDMMEIDDIHAMHSKALRFLKVQTQTMKDSISSDE